MISGIGGGSLLPLKLGFFSPVNSDELRWWAQSRKKSRPPQFAASSFGGFSESSALSSTLDSKCDKNPSR
jgi:hypothetical protein